MQAWFRSQKHRDYINNKRANDPTLRFNRAISTALTTALKENNHKRKVFKMLSFSLKDLKERLTKTIPVGYSLNDYGQKLELDHIIPKRVYKNIEENNDDLYKCWNLRNLRLVTKEENLKKSDKLNYELIEQYDIHDLLPDLLGG